MTFLVRTSIVITLMVLGLHTGLFSTVQAADPSDPRPLFTRSADPIVPSPEIGLPNLVKGLFSKEVTTENFIYIVAEVIINFLLLATGIIAFFYIFYGGFRYLTAGGDSGAADAGKKTVIGAIVGVVIASLSYVVVRAVLQLINAQFDPSALTHYVVQGRWWV